MNKKYNFSGRHWLTIAICFLLFMLANAVTSDSENLILPIWASDHQIDYALILPLITVAGCVSIIGNLILGKVCEKMGAKFLIILCLIATACFVFIYGTSTNRIVLLIGLIGTVCFGQSLSYLGANAVIANWFPHKKGLAMGFVSVGPPVATIVMMLGLKAVITHAGVHGGIYTICAVLIVVAVICAIFIKNTPEQIGCTPDNMTEEELELLAKEDLTNEAKSTVLTTGQVLKRKEFWLIAIIIGICSITQTGLMAQWLVRYQDTRFESMAGLLMSICAVVGIFGSMIAGYIENRMGTKGGFAFLAIWFAVALVLNYTSIPVLVYISIPMFGLIITLFQIFMPAFELSCFGRDNFKQVNAIMFPILSICGQLSFLLIAACIKIFGEVRYVYLVFAVLLFISLIPNFLLPIGKRK